MMNTTNSSSSSAPLAKIIVGSEKEGEGQTLRSVSTVDTTTTHNTTYMDSEIHTENVQLGVTPDQLWVAQNPFPNEDLRVALSRSYLIDVVTWTSSSVGTNLSGFANVDIFATLLAIPNIAEHIAYYAYFRCKAVRVTVRVNATPWHYGVLVISSTVNNSYLYHNSTNAQSRQYMQNNPVLIMANQANAVDYDIPWCAKEQWSEVTNAHIVHPMTLRITVASVLSMLGSSLTDALVSVFANFVEPEVAFPVANSVSRTSVARRVTAQSHKEKRVNKEAQQKTEDFTMATSIRSFTDTTLEVFNSALSVAEKLGPYVAMVADKPTSLRPVQNVSLQPGSSMTHTRGLDTSIKLAADPEASTGVSHGSMGDVLGNPSLLQVIMTPGYSDRFSFTNSTAEGTKLVSIYIHPMNQIYKVSTGATENYTFGPMTWFAQLFRYWRGSIKVGIYFVSCTFITFRVRIVWFPEWVTPPATITDNESGDYVSKVVEVVGSMLVEFSVPWICKDLYRQVVDPGINLSLAWEPDDYGVHFPNGIVCVYLLAPLVTVNSSLVPTVNGLIYTAAGEDMQLAGLCTTLQFEDNNDTYRVSPTSCVYKDFSRPFEPIIASTSSFEFGLASSEQFTDLVSLGKRFTQRALYPDVGASNNLTLLASDAFFLQNALIVGDSALTKWVSACHVNFRGSLRWKILQASYTASTAIGTATAGYYPIVNTKLVTSQATYVSENSVSKFYEVEVPYMEATPWVSRNLFSNSNVRMTVPVTAALTTTMIGTKMLAFGDDFAMGVYQSPPWIAWTAVASGRGGVHATAPDLVPHIPREGRTLYDLEGTVWSVPKRLASDFCQYAQGVLAISPVKVSGVVDEGKILVAYGIEDVLDHYKVSIVTLKHGV